MFTLQQLRQQLSSINRKSYPAYKGLKGVYSFRSFLLSIDHVQGDPFASPSHLSIQVPAKTAGFPEFCFSTKAVRIAMQDYLLRKFSQQLSIYSFKAKGSGKSGSISTTVCGQEILERTACEINSEFVTVRFTVGFPANGRTINAFELEKILFDFLPSCVEKSLLYKNLSPKAVENVVFLAEDQEFLRQELKKRHLVAFVANSSILPRESGISQKPMKNAVPFQSPASLETEVTLPHKGKIKGMAIPQGITLIAGGGYHGKSTLLTALEAGVYNHIAGDGREFVLTDASAVKLRAEDGRFIKDVDISLFINDLPNEKDTHCFSTLDASGSTSQAAGIVEGMEAGSTLFLLDEDTSATNFMVRDAFMQQVISRDKEPITPFLERAPQLFAKAGISTILVAGSSGAFFHIANTVIQMDHYQAVDITEKVKKLCSDYPLPPSSVPDFSMPICKRIMSSTKKSTYKDFKVKCHGRDSFSIGKDTVDLRYIEQLADREQTAALGELLRYAQEYLIDGKRTVPEIVSILQKDIEKDGFSKFFGNSYIPCGLAVPRIQEIFSCFNRCRRP
ncbi:MAG: ABC-ATPase domain-containing protein [Bacillota bacterium]|nr:ABC-ATPase domain-containing protein [Bacillota bacterium]